MKITKIKPQKRNKERCSIYIDGEYKFGLTQDIALKYGLNEGDDISEDTIEILMYHEELAKIRQRAFKILSYRERSTTELRQRLLDVGYETSLVDRLIQEFVDDNTLNDLRFAKAFVNDYTNLKPRGNRFLARELKKKGIPQTIIDELLESHDEKRIVKSFLEKKLAAFDPKDPKGRQKIIRRLLSRGFTLDSIYAIINHDD